MFGCNRSVGEGELHTEGPVRERVRFLLSARVPCPRAGKCGNYTGSGGICVIQQALIDNVVGGNESSVVVRCLLVS